MATLATQMLMHKIRQQKLAAEQLAIKKAQEEEERQRQLEQVKKAPAVYAAPEITKQELEAQPAQAVLGKNEITFAMLNARQKRSVTMAKKGVSFVTTGAAGTGKTTVTRHSLKAATESGRIGVIQEEIEHKHLRRGYPSVAIVSYTNVATNNIKAILPAELAQHTMTAHKLLQYAPEAVTTEVYDEYGSYEGDKTTQRFIPTYGTEPSDHGGSGLGNNALLPHLDLLVIEESGTMPVWLFLTILSALPHPEKTQFIFLGDIEQLEPAFGDGILGYKMLELPRIELVETYRNIGLVTKFAHRILSGKELGDKEAAQWNVEDESGRIELRQFKKSRSTWEQALAGMGSIFRKMAREGEFNPDNTMVLIPFNVKFGTDEMGKYIAQGFTDQDYKQVHEVVVGRWKQYFCIGDRLFIDKSYYELVDIQPTKHYMGEAARPASRCLDRWGRVRLDLPVHIMEEERAFLMEHSQDKEEMSADDIDDFLAMTQEDMEGSSMKASHTLTIRRVNTLNNMDAVKDTEEVNSIGRIRDIRFSYALTVFKAQGSEWENVHYILHSCHSVMACREQVYTACTRARRNLTVWYDGDDSGGLKNSMLRKGITKQNIVGQGIEEKLNHFRKKLNLPVLSLTEIMKLKIEQKALDQAAETADE